MDFKTHNDKTIDVCGTSLVGEINVGYNKLKKVFGNPTDSDGYKSDAEWEIEFEDGETASIYNWEDGKNYNKKNGLPKTKITNWHIGAKNDVIVNRIEALLK